LGEQVTIPFETDGEGNVITKPVTGWNVMPAAGIAVLLQIQYADNQLDIEKGMSKAFQFFLMPQECLELAVALTRQAKRLLEETLPPGQVPN
jgi:hypothetical protein